MRRRSSIRRLCGRPRHGGVPASRHRPGRWNVARRARRHRLLNLPRTAPICARGGTPEVSCAWHADSDGARLQYLVTAGRHRLWRAHGWMQPEVFRQQDPDQPEQRSRRGVSTDRQCDAIAALAWHGCGLHIVCSVSCSTRSTNLVGVHCAPSVIGRGGSPLPRRVPAPALLVDLGEW